MSLLEQAAAPADDAPICYTAGMDEKRDNAAPKPRRRLQFSLRTLLIVVAMLGVLFAVGRYVADQAKIVAERKAWIEAHGRGWVTGTVDFAQGDPEKRPSIIRRWLGDVAADNIEVHGSNTDLKVAAALFPEANIVKVW